MMNTGENSPDNPFTVRKLKATVAQLEAEIEAYRWLIKELPLRLFDEIADKAPPNIREHFYSDTPLTGKDE